VPGGTSNKASGVVHGLSVQARQIRGDVHTRQPSVPLPGPLPPPGQLPLSMRDRCAARSQAVRAGQRDGRGDDRPSRERLWPGPTRPQP
jgi:hypothetical protein